MAEAPLALRLAARELRAGPKGFAIFLACIALGVAAIAAAGSTAQAFRAGLAAQARQIVGGDLAVTVRQRAFTPTEKAAFARIGTVSYAVAVRAMAQAQNGQRRLVELRGVSADWPLAGAVQLAGGASLGAALAPAGAAAGAAVELPLLQRLDLRLGERFMVGNSPVVARAVLVSEPDSVGRGFALGPTVLTRLEAVEAGGFLAPGVPFAATARIVIPAGESLAQARRRLVAALPTGPVAGGWRIRDRNDAAPGLRHLIDQLEYFLGFVGLASLLAGGLGVAGAVSARLEASAGDIAILKVLGAKGALVRDIHLIEIGVMAGIGILVGLVVGAAVPLLLGASLAADLPVPALFGLYPWPLARAAAFGVLSTAAFSLIPLARARATPPSALLRKGQSPPAAFGPETLGAGVAALALAALTLATAPTPAVACVMIGAVAASFALLWLLGLGATAGAARLRGRARGPLRMGLANLAGPGSAARSATPAIGLGVALVAAVVLIQANLIGEVAQVAPKTAPDLIFTDIPAARGGEFDAAVARAFRRPLSSTDYLRAPFVTGRIIRVRGDLIDRRRIDPAHRWAYDNDIDLSVIGAQPPGAGVVAGRWWPANYAGPPLAALSQDAAEGAKVQLGDIVGIAVLGREIDARVAALRKFDYASFGANFPVILDPAALAGADLSFVAIAKASRAQEARVTAGLGRDFPLVNVISVRDQLQAAADLLGRLALAVRSLASVVAVAGLLVLVGAIAAGAAARARETAILKVLGATRGQIIATCVIEYGAVGAISGAAGVGLGCLAAFFAVTAVFRAHWSLDWRALALLAAIAPILAAAAGLAAAARALAHRPAPVLRA